MSPSIDLGMNNNQIKSMFRIPILFPAPSSDASASTDSSKAVPSLPAGNFPAEAYAGVNPLKRESSSRNPLVTTHSISLEDVQATATTQKMARKKGDTERVHYKVSWPPFELDFFQLKKKICFKMNSKWYWFA